MIRALVLFSLLAPAVPNVAIGPDVESTAKPVDAPIKTVIVFSDRAKIIRHGVAELGAEVFLELLGAASGGEPRTALDALSEEPKVTVPFLAVVAFVEPHGSPLV